MKESFGSTWLFQIVILFILIFSGYIALSINKSKAYSIKDDIINIIERNGYVDLSKTSDPVLVEIADRLKTVSYHTDGKCPQPSKDDPTIWIGYSRDGNINNNNAIYCMSKIKVNDGSQDLPEMYFYRVLVFYQLDLPVVNQIFSFKVKGDTKMFYNSSEKGSKGSSKSPDFHYWEKK